MNDDILDKLTKRDLIKIIANMHDTVQEWNNGWGLTIEEGDALIKIGSACASKCNEQNDWIMPSFKINNNE